MVNKKKRVTTKLDEEKISMLRLLRSNGASYTQIAKMCGVGYGSVQKYAQDVELLPPSMRKNPFELLPAEATKEQYRSRIPNPADYKAQKNKEYWAEQHEPGTPLDAPEGMFSLTELQEMMEEPTHFHSDLSMKAWAQKYLEGPKNFLKYAPYEWGKGQLEIFDLWEKHQKIMIECHRDYGKTMAVDAILLHEICENLENNYAICSETDHKARARVKHIGDNLLKNKKIIKDYGFLPHQKIYKGTRQSWTKGEITVKREISQTDPTLMCFSSVSKGATGAHFNGIVFDDVWSRILDRNPDNKEKWLEWFDGELEGCLEDAWECWVLTRKGVTDLYQTMEDRQYYVVYRRPAVVKFPSNYEYKFKTVEGNKIFDKVVVKSKDWILSDPTRFTIEFFLEKKMKMNAAEWESEYQLNPTARTGVYWKWSNLRFIDDYSNFLQRLAEKKESHKTRIIGSMDLAFGASARSDFTALTIIGYYETKFYLLELYLERAATEASMAKLLIEAKKTFPTMETVYIEADLQQSERVEALKKRVPILHILPILSRQEQALLDKASPDRKTTNLSGKPLRIWSQLEAKIESNTLYINKTMRNFKEFKDEFATFPKCDHFDVLDALGMGVSKMTSKGALIYAFSGL